MSAVPGEVTVRRRGLYILPTRHGWTFAMVLVVLLLCAINYDNSLAYGLAFLLAAVAIVSMLYTDRNLLNLHVRARATNPVFAGDVAVFQVHLLNTGASARYGITLVHAKEEIARTDIGPKTSAAVELHTSARRRGWLPMPPFHLKTRFPLGILYSWTRRLTMDERCLVYPQPSGPWAWQTNADTDDVANLRSSAGGDDFSGVREYRAGDSPRQIDWKSVARGRGLLTKEFASGVSETFSFDLMNVPEQDTEKRLSMICRAIMEAEQAGFRYGLRLGVTVIEPGSGEQHERHCLRALALYGQED